MFKQFVQVVTLEGFSVPDSDNPLNISTFLRF